MRMVKISSASSHSVNCSKYCNIAYLRVSTAEQAESGAGLAAQRAAIEDYAIRHGLEVDRWFTDEAVSGSVAPLDRPGLAEALAMLARCKAGVLLIHKGDRIARKTADLLALRDLSERQHWTLSAADGSVDWSTAHGRAMSTVMGAFSELERDLIRARTRDALQARKAAGKRLGRPATLSAEVRDWIKSERIAGHSFAYIADGLNQSGVQTARGGVRWYPSTVKAVMDSHALDAQSAEWSSDHTAAR